MRRIRAELVYPGENSLGEGPFTALGNEIRWFDIFGSSVYMHTGSGGPDAAAGGIEIPGGFHGRPGMGPPGRTDGGPDASAGSPALSGQVRKISLNNYLCCAGEARGNAIVAAGETGVFLLDGNFEIIRTICSPPFDTGEQRFNDGKAGPDGAFWAGSMSYNGDKPIGGLYRIGGEVTRVLDGMIIPNGLGWSPDGCLMYITDSGRSEISQWDFDPESGAISNRRLFVKTPDGEGVPDGLTVDSKGTVWSARWGGSRVVGYAPDGRVTAEINVEAENPSSCCFAGPDYRMLYITSARHGVKEPGAGDGALFRADTGTKGQTPCLFRYT